MKRIILFFAVCLGLSVSQTTFADDAEMARAAAKRSTNTTVSTTQNTGANSTRSVSSNRKTEPNANKNARTATKPVQTRAVSSRTPGQQSQQNVKQRAAVTKPVAQQSVKHVSTKSRNAATRTVDARGDTINTLRSATTPNKKHNARAAATVNVEKMANIKSKDYSKCKTVYFECMDEFCANKDSNLRRCACSSRIHEFDTIKKQLSDAEDKMLDFNQRLLTVSLDKEDAEAINVATEGETAYNVKDKTESEKLLQKITATLNNSGDSKLNNNLSSISLSLDIDSAFDSIDSLGGIATSSKTGVDLYNAARPVCIEMAHEVCSDDELNIAQNSYKLTIQQDCETVAKSYTSRYNQAQEKIHESSALLDMSRLNLYQQKNSDDILTCKKKILTQLSDNAVCGEDLHKCLDTTGQYINPSDGSAFLSSELHNLSTLLQEPGTEEKWSTVAQNESFVKFLNTKKEFLEPATEQCEEIADVVWQDFLEDALAKIKLAQNAKLEEIRQSCTQLIAECKTTTLTDLSELDPRALSTFNVASDKTVNLMCADIETSCIALMTDIDKDENWESGVTGITADITYDKLIESCTQIGRDCFIRQCNGTAGNFALCQSATDDKRRELLNRTTCWDEVLECVSAAHNIDKITGDILDDRQTYYDSLYSGITYTNIPTFCNGKSGNDRIACLITEQLWGNCEYKPDHGNIVEESDHNKILMPNNGSTLLSWFAQSTGTTDARDSCNSRGCPIGYTLNETTKECESKTQIEERSKISPKSGLTNNCLSGVLDVFGNCCYSHQETVDGKTVHKGYTSNGICVPSDKPKAILFQTVQCDGGEYDDSGSKEERIKGRLCPNKTKRKISVYCVTTQSSGITYDDGDSGVEYTCDDGIWVLVDEYGNYFDIHTPAVENLPSTNYVIMYYDTTNGGSERKCEYKGYWWKNPNNSDSCGTIDKVPQENEFIVSYL